MWGGRKKLIRDEREEAIRSEEEEESRKGKGAKIKTWRKRERRKRVKGGNQQRSK